MEIKKQIADLIALAQKPELTPGDQLQAAAKLLLLSSALANGAKIEADVFDVFDTPARRGFAVTAIAQALASRLQSL